MRIVLTIACALSSLCTVVAVQKPSVTKTSLSESELRTLAKADPDVKNAGLLYLVAMASSNNVERKLAYLKAAAACLIACGKQDIYKKRVKGELQDAAEFESELTDDCKRCSGSGKKGLRCYACSGKGKCPVCKGARQVRAVKYSGFNKYHVSKPCSKCNKSGHCQRCGGEGLVEEKCLTCAGTGKVISQTVAARVWHDSCTAIADSMAAKVRAKVEAEERERRRKLAEAKAKAEAEERERNRKVAEERAKAEAAERERKRIAAEARAKAEADERKRKYIAEADGNADVLCARGCKYYLGKGVLQDYCRAIEYLDCASQIGCSRADCILAHMYLDGKGCKQDDDTKTKSFVHAKKGLACKDNKFYEIAAYTLGVLYCTGFKDALGSYQMDTYQAYNYFSTCESNSDALFFKGQMEYHGIGTDKNPAKAAETFYAVTKVNNDNFNKGRAQMCLGYIYLFGEGVAKNIPLAWKMLREGVELAYPKLVKAAKEPPTVYDFKRFKNAFGNGHSIHSPFSWKMRNLYEGKGKFNFGGKSADILEKALSILFAAEYWSGLGIEYDLLPEGY